MAGDLNLRLRIDALVRGAREVADLAAQTRNLGEQSRRPGGDPTAPLREGATRTQGAVESLVGSLRGLVAGAAIAAGIQRSVAQFQQAEAALRGLQSQARFTGESMGAAFQTALRLSADGLLTVTEASRALQNLLASGLSLREAERLVRALGDSAAFGRASHLAFGEAVVSAAEGIRNQNSVLVDNAGVTKNLSVMWREYAQEIGKSVNDLTDAEKAQAAYLGVLRESEAQQGNAARAAQGLGGALAGLWRAISEVAVVVGEMFAPSIGLAARGGTALLNHVVKPLIFRFQSLGAVVARVAADLGALIDLASHRSLDRLNERFRENARVFDEVVTDLAGRIDRGLTRSAADALADTVTGEDRRGGGAAGRREQARRAAEEFLARFRTDNEKLADEIARYRKLAAEAQLSPAEIAAGEARIRASRPAPRRAPARVAPDLSAQRLALVRASAEAEFRLLKDELDRQQREIEAALDQSLISYREAADQRIAIATQEVDAQIAARRRELAEVESIARAAPDEGRRLAAQAQARTLGAELVLLERQRLDVVAAARREEEARTRALDEQFGRLREELARLTGTDTAESRRAAIERELAPMIDRLRAESRPQDAQLLERLVGARAASEDLRRFEQQYARVLARAGLARQQIEVEERAGLITQAQARERLIELNRQLGAELEALIPVAERANAALGNPDTALRIEQARAQVRELRTVTDEVAVRVRGELHGAFSGLFSDVTARSKSFGDAILSALDRLRSGIMNIIADRLGQRLVDSLLGPASGGRTPGFNPLGLLASWIGGTFGGVRPISPWQHHSGGLVGARAGIRRTIDPSVFLGAPRLHMGGLVGLRSGERPIIAQDDEEVLTRADPRHRLNGGGRVVVNVIEAPGRGGETAERSAGGELNFDVFVERITSRQIAATMAGDGFDALLRGRYGANPAAGLMR